MPDSGAFFREPNPQSLQKLKILRHYCLAWAAILGRGGGGREPVLNAVETHAGRGQYDTGEPGSPLVTLQALDAVARNSTSAFRANVHLIELDADNVQGLRQAVATGQWHACIRWRIDTGDAGVLLPQVLERIDSPAPAFFFVDPFGYSDLRFDQLLQVLGHGERHELMLTFMSSFLFRFLSDHTKRLVQEDLLGPYAGWRQWVGQDGAELQVIDHFCDRLEREGLRTVGRQPLTHVIEVTTAERHRPYVLLHVSQHPKARLEMENAVRRAGVGQQAAPELFGASMAESAILATMTGETQDLRALDLAAEVWRRHRHLTWWADIRVALKQLHGSGRIAVLRDGAPLSEAVSTVAESDIVRLRR